MPEPVPRQPACTAATTRRPEATNKIGTQSAVNTVRAILATAVESPSASPASPGLSTEIMRSPCTCCIVAKRMVSPVNGTTRRQFSRTASLVSSTRNDRFNSANGPRLTPPRRPQNPCTRLGISSHPGTRRTGGWSNAAHPAATISASLGTTQSHEFAQMRRAGLLQMQDHVDRPFHFFLAQSVACLATELVLNRSATLIEWASGSANGDLLLGLKRAPVFHLDAYARPE